MTKKAWIIFAAACVVLFGIIIVLNKKPSIDVSNVDASKIVTGTYADHVFGNPKSKIVLVEYGDFQCPYCGDAYSKVKAVSQTYKNQVAVIFRNYPLTTAHPNALASATAAEAAAKQGKFWEMHDMLYENQNSWSDASTDQRDAYFESYAKTLGLNVDKFKTDELSSSVADKISFDQALGNKQGVQGTPAFYLNGKAVDQTTSGDIINGDGSKLEAQLDTLIKKDGGTPPAKSTS